VRYPKWILSGYHGSRASTAIPQQYLALALSIPGAGEATFRRRTDEEVRAAAAKHANLRKSEHVTKAELDAYIGACGIKFPSEFSRLPYWDEVKDYLIDLMHLIKNLGEHVLDTMMGTDFDAKTRSWAKEQGIKRAWWETGTLPKNRVNTAMTLS